MQKHVMLSVMEEEQVAVVIMVQDMMYIYRIVTTVGLHIELSMAPEMDNSGEHDLANSWKIDGRRCVNILPVIPEGRQDGSF